MRFSLSQARSLRSGEGDVAVRRGEGTEESVVLIEGNGSVQGSRAGHEQVGGREVVTLKHLLDQDTKNLDVPHDGSQAAHTHEPTLGRVAPRRAAWRATRPTRRPA